jgi:hypothetical protein
MIIKLEVPDRVGRIVELAKKLDVPVTPCLVFEIEEVIYHEGEATLSDEVVLGAARMVANAVVQTNDGSVRVAMLIASRTVGMTLLPCPFCGGEAKLTSDYGQDSGTYAEVTCTRCKATVSGAYTPGSGTPKEKAVAVWNERTRNE